MAELLRGIEGRFILSLNDRSEVCELFGEFELEKVETTCSANVRSMRRVGELPIRGGGRMSQPDPCTLPGCGPGVSAPAGDDRLSMD